MTEPRDDRYEGPTDELDAEELDAWEETRASFGWLQISGPAHEEVARRLRRFESCGEGTGTRLLEAYGVAGPAPHTLCLVRRPYRGEAGGYARGTLKTVIEWELRLLGLLELPAEAGRALIRPESLSDKLLELFKPVEVDFDESPEFSRRYYVLATDEAALRGAIEPAALDHLGSRTDLYAEIFAEDLVVAWPAVPKPEAMEEPAAFFEELAAAVGRQPGAPYR